MGTKIYPMYETFALNGKKIFNIKNGILQYSWIFEHYGNNKVT